MCQFMFGWENYLLYPPDEVWEKLWIHVGFAAAVSVSTAEISCDRCLTQS